MSTPRYCLRKFARLRVSLVALEAKARAGVGSATTDDEATACGQMATASILMLARLDAFLRDYRQGVRAS
jgi:hypothetical protein